MWHGLLSRAFYIARSGRPGPVVLDFTKNAQVATCEWEPVKCEKVTSYNPYPEIDAKSVEEAAELINNAKRPFALVGHGVELGGAHNELLEFLEKADILRVAPCWACRLCLRLIRSTWVCSVCMVLMLPI